MELEKSEIDGCIKTAMHLSGHIIDRKDLHVRDDLERFINILMGEVAEFMTIKWLHSNNKYARSAVNKTSNSPDLGHDIEVKKKNTNDLLSCSVKSSISYKFSPLEILENCRLATKKSELRDINIQVYFWLTLDPKPNNSRVTVPSIRQSAIIGWFGKKDLKEFATYNHERREAPADILKDGRTMNSLLSHLA